MIFALLQGPCQNRKIATGMIAEESAYGFVPRRPVSHKDSHGALNETLDWHDACNSRAPGFLPVARPERGLWEPAKLRPRPEAK